MTANPAPDADAHAHADAQGQPTATPSPSPPRPPHRRSRTPTGVIATVVDERVNLGWNAPTPSVKQFRVYRSTVSGFTPAEAEKSVIVPGAADLVVTTSRGRGSARTTTGWWPRTPPAELSAPSAQVTATVADVVPRMFISQRRAARRPPSGTRSGNDVMGQHPAGSTTTRAR